MIDLFARLRPVGERRMARRVGLVDGDAEFGAAPDEAFAALQRVLWTALGLRPSVANSSSEPSWRFR